MSVGGDSEGTWSRPDIRGLKMSHVEAGASIAGGTDEKAGGSGSALLLSGSGVDSRVVMLYSDGAMKFDWTHWRLSRSQLLQIGFFSSHLAWRVLHVLLYALSVIRIHEYR